MSKNKRLQVLLSAKEIATYKRHARANNMTLSQWVRFSLSRIVDQSSAASIDRKISALNKVRSVNAPIGDIEVLKSEIEQGYLK